MPPSITMTCRAMASGVYRLVGPANNYTPPTHGVSQRGPKTSQTNVLGIRLYSIKAKCSYNRSCSVPSFIKRRRR